MMASKSTHRTPVQVYLDPKQLDLLRSLAARRDAPVTHLVRESVERYLVEELGDGDPLLGLIGMIASGEADTAVEHDRVLTEAQHDRLRAKTERPARVRR